VEELSDEDDDDSRHQRLKARFLRELRRRRRHQLSAHLLQTSYDQLLRSHAEKELAIEQLRLGARVCLVNVDPPPSAVPRHAPLTDSLPAAAAAAERPLVFSMATTASSVASQPALSAADDDGLQHFSDHWLQ